MPRIPALTLLLLFHGASGESGLTSDDGQLEDIEPEPPEYECVMALSSPADNWHNLTCFLKESIHKHSNITFGVCCNNEGPCLELKKKKKGKYVLHSPDLSLILPCKVCIFPMSKEKRCSVYVLYQIVKPEAPNSLTITYHKDAKEYIISFVAASGYLKDKLIHQVIIRKNNGTWEEVEELRFLQFRLLEQKLARGAKYEVKVRSKPDGMFYKGSWSGWSKSEHFQTSEGVPGPAQEGLPLMTITLSTLGTLLLFIMIVIVFLWEKRIKPYAWPHIPDHKTTLEQLCKKQRKSHKIIFNPDYFMDLHIHKVDGIQAKTQEECFLEPSNIQGLGVPGENTVPDNMLEECAMMQGIQLECPQDGSLCESGGTSLTTLDGSTTHELEGRNLGVMQLYDRPNVHNRTLKDTGAISGQVICGKNNSEIPELLTNAIRVLRQEEAYVTMSAFPPTGITQRRQ